MHVACCVDESFAADCAVMLSSLLEANDPADVHIHLIHDDGLTQASVAALADVATRAGGQLSPLTIADERIGCMPASQRFPRLTWYRVFLPDLFPHLTRMIYLDTDILVTGSLRELWETDLNRHWLGAVTNPLFADMARRVEDQLGIPNGAHYFNSGVLLLDLAALRESAAIDKLLRFVEEHPGQPWPDQDALNAVMHTHWLELHPRWNAMPGLFELPLRYLPHDRDVVQAAVEDPAIIHFVGPHKPWHYRSKHPYRSEWFRHLRSTAWADRDIEGRTALGVVLRRLPPIWALRIELKASETRARVAAHANRVRARVGRWLT